MKQKRKLALFTFGIFCLWPSITAKKTDQNKSKEKPPISQNKKQSTLLQEDSLDQNIKSIFRTVQEAKNLAEKTKKESAEWRKQVDKTTKTADKITTKLSDSAHKISSGIDTLKHESREWRKESEEMRREIGMLRLGLDKQVGKLMVKGTGVIFLSIAAIGAVLKSQFSNEKGSYLLLGTIIGIGTLGGTLLFML